MKLPYLSTNKGNWHGHSVMAKTIVLRKSTMMELHVTKYLVFCTRIMIAIFQYTSIKKLDFIWVQLFLFWGGAYILYLSVEGLGFHGGLDSKESACNVGDLDSIPGSERYPGEGNGNPLQYSCLENPHGQRRLAGYSPWGCKEPGTTVGRTLSHSR